MTYHVRVLRKAEADLDATATWLAKRSPAGARRWLSAFEQILDAMEENPLQFGLAPENETVAYEIRQAIFRTPRGMPYRALFTVAGSQVRVLRIRGPRQDLLRPDDF